MRQRQISKAAAVSADEHGSHNRLASALSEAQKQISFYAIELGQSQARTRSYAAECLELNTKLAAAAEAVPSAATVALPPADATETVPAAAVLGKDAGGKRAKSPAKKNKVPVVDKIKARGAAARAATNKAPNKAPFGSRVRPLDKSPTRQHKSTDLPRVATLNN